MLRIDVVIATQFRPQMLRRCLESLVTAAKGCSLRFIVSSSGSDEGYHEVFYDFPAIHIHSTNPLNAAAARNRALPFLQSEWVYFIDDDAHVEREFFSVFSKIALENPDSAVIGGPNLTCKEATEFQKTSGAVLASRFAASRCALRYTRKHPQQKRTGELSLISCNLFVKRKALEGLRFPENLRSNEENWLMQDLKANGHAFLYDPNLYVWHERRGNLYLFASQIYRYGFGRGQNMRLRPATAKLDFIVPSAALLIALFVLSINWLPWGGIFFAGYFATLSIAVLRLELSSLSSRLKGAALIPLIHVCYGCGVLRGLVDRG